MLNLNFNGLIADLEKIKKINKNKGFGSRENSRGNLLKNKIINNIKLNNNLDKNYLLNFLINDKMVIEKYNVIYKNKNKFMEKWVKNDFERLCDEVFKI